MKKFKSFFEYYYPITEYKIFKLKLLYSDDILFVFNLDWKKKTDKAGLTFKVGILGYHCVVSVKDTRQWNYDNDDWIKSKNWQVRTDFT